MPEARHSAPLPPMLAVEWWCPNHRIRTTANACCTWAQATVWQDEENADDPT